MVKLLAPNEQYLRSCREANDESQVFLGKISIRHRLTDALLRYGGHIGYGIRYSQWNKGYGTLLLKLALEKAGEMGIHEVLIHP